MFVNLYDEAVKYARFEEQRNKCPQCGRPVPSPSGLVCFNDKCPMFPPKYSLAEEKDAA